MDGHPGIEKGGDVRVKKGYRLWVIGKPRNELDVDLLVQAILAIAGQQRNDQPEEPEAPREESA